jgi:hypothetical protein
MDGINDRAVALRSGNRRAASWSGRGFLVALPTGERCLEQVPIRAEAFV